MKQSTRKFRLYGKFRQFVFRRFVEMLEEQRPNWEADEIFRDVLLAVQRYIGYDEHMLARDLAVSPDTVVKWAEGRMQASGREKRRVVGCIQAKVLAALTTAKVIEFSKTKES